MSDVDNQYSILPDNRTKLERGFEIAFSKLLYDIPNPFPDVVQVDQTPVHVLPHLANDSLVTDWNSAAPESEKRATVKNAKTERRFAGTQKAIALALDSLEYDAEITPWYQQTPQGNPYTFNVLAFRRDGAPINSDILERMQYRINDIKSLRDEYNLSLAYGQSASLALSIVPQRPVVEFEHVSVGIHRPIIHNDACLTLNGGARHYVMIEL